MPDSFDLSFLGADYYALLPDYSANALWAGRPEKIPAGLYHMRITDTRSSAAASISSSPCLFWKGRGAAEPLKCASTSSRPCPRYAAAATSAYGTCRKSAGSGKRTLSTRISSGDENSEAMSGARNAGASLSSTSPASTALTAHGPAWRLSAGTAGTREAASPECLTLTPGRRRPSPVPAAGPHPGTAVQRKKIRT